MTENVMPQAETQVETPTEAQAETPAALNDSEILDLYKSAGPEAQNAAASLLKGEKLQDANSMSALSKL